MFEHYTFGMQARPPVRRRSRELSPGEVPAASVDQQCGQSQFRSQCPSPPLSATAVSPPPPPPPTTTRIPDCTPAPDSIDSLARELSRQNLQLDRRNLERLQLQLSSPSASPSIPCMSPIPPCPELEIDDEPPRPGPDSRRGRRDVAVPPPSPMDVDQTPVVADTKRLSRQRSSQFKHNNNPSSQSQAVQTLVEGMIAARSQCNVRGPSPPLLTPTSAARLGPILEPDDHHHRIELDADCVNLQVDDAYANGGSGSPSDAEREEMFLVETMMSLRRAAAPAGVRKLGLLQYRASADAALSCANVVRSRPRMRKRASRMHRDSKASSSMVSSAFSSPVVPPSLADESLVPTRQL